MSVVKVMVRVSVCASESVSQGIPVSLKTLNLNKRLGRVRASEQEIGSHINLMWIDQSEGRRGVKNATFHPRWVWLVNRKDGKLKVGVRLQFFQVIPAPPPPPSSSSTMI